MHGDFLVKTGGSVVFIAEVTFRIVPTFGVVELVGVDIGNDDADCRVGRLIERMIPHIFNLHWVERGEQVGGQAGCQIGGFYGRLDGFSFILLFRHF